MFKLLGKVARFDEAMKVAMSVPKAILWSVDATSHVAKLLAPSSLSRQHDREAVGRAVLKARSKRR